MRRSARDAKESSHLFPTPLLPVASILPFSFVDAMMIKSGSRSLYWVSVSVSSVGISKLKQTAVKGIEKGAQRYYELGPDDPPYAAKFYDCCGAEDPDAPGCKVASHISYDDE
ncbi:hypothetical protein KSS87_017420 [Heliosperma pusillum]|nr:hypothetical protein KSS87_017420 [Heliosperma pusillum]